MNNHLHPVKLFRLSAHLGELFSQVISRGSLESMPPELADEIAATAGEIMVELADQREDQLARHVIEDARRLREIMRTVSPEPSQIKGHWHALASDLELVIREDKRAA